MRISLLALALASTAIMAQDVKLGVQAQANLPMGDLKDAVDSKVGIGVGVHAQFSLGNGMAIRARGDFNTWPETDVFPAKNKVSNLNLGGDFLFYVEGKDTTGVYFLGGLSMVRWSYEVKVAGVKHNYDSTHLGLSVGLGYQWNTTFGTEARYAHSSLGSGLNGDTFSVGATLKF
ncbi:MAG TPA: outer membrane beta-barrel protein [Holophagaceae bacterium]|nr:outer membrane beta-barrel protein [Holophagaceae bacterium]